MGCQHGNAFNECPDQLCRSGSNNLDDLADELAKLRCEYNRLFDRVIKMDSAVCIHWDHAGSAFCGSRGRILAVEEDRVSCKRCLHKIGIQYSV